MRDVAMTKSELESYEALLCMWMRRCAAHPMLEVAVIKWMQDLAQLDHELKGENDGRPTFEEALDWHLRQREAEIRSGRKGAKVDEEKDM